MKLTALNRLIGLEVVAVKGNKHKHSLTIEAEYILMSNGKTIIRLEEQDYHSYHDCASSARHLYIYDNQEEWEFAMHNLPDANNDSFIG